MAKKKELKMLTRNQLMALDGKRLKNVLNSARAVYSANMKAVNEIECDAVDPVLQGKLRESRAYVNLVKEVMGQHGDIE